MNIPVKIDIPARKADRVFGDEPSQTAVVPSGAVVSETGKAIVLAPGEGIQFRSCFFGFAINLI